MAWTGTATELGAIDRRPAHKKPQNPCSVSSMVRLEGNSIMPYKKPTIEEFDIEENLVTHRPTKATFRRSYPSQPLSTDMMINYGLAGSVLENGDDYDREDIRVMAVRLLFVK